MMHKYTLVWSTGTYTGRGRSWCVWWCMVHVVCGRCHHINGVGSCRKHYLIFVTTIFFDHGSNHLQDGGGRARADESSSSTFPPGPVRHHTRQVTTTTLQRVRRQSSFDAGRSCCCRHRKKQKRDLWIAIRNNGVSTENDTSCDRSKS